MKSQVIHIVYYTLVIRTIHSNNNNTKECTCNRCITYIKLVLKFFIKF